MERSAADQSPQVGISTARSAYAGMAGYAAVLILTTETFTP